MSEHDVIRKMLALYAAGALGVEESTQVQHHVRGCESCRTELETWGLYARGLRQQPQPLAPPDLMARAQARVLWEREDAARRRFEIQMLAGLVVFSWGINVGFWAVARVLTGGTFSVMGANLVSPGSWFFMSLVMTWVTAGVAAVALAKRRELRRSL